MNPVLGIIGNMLGGAGNAQANSARVGSQNGNVLNNILGIYNTLKNSGNYMQAIEAMSQNNPLVKQGMDMVNQNGGDMKAAFLKLAEQYGVDPNNIINMIK